MDAFTTKFGAPRDSWNLIKVFFNWNVSEDFHIRTKAILDEFSKNEKLADLLESEGFKRDSASAVAMYIHFGRSAKMTELVLSLDNVAVLYHIMEIIVHNTDDVKTDQPEKYKPFEEFYQSFFKLISLGAPMPGPLDSISKMVETLVRMQPGASEKIDAKFKKQVDDFHRHPKLHDRSGRKYPTIVTLIDLRRPEAMQLGNTQVIFRWFVPIDAHRFLMHFIERNKPHLYKVLGNPDKISAFEGILEKLELGQQIDNYRTALFVTSYLSAITLTEICHVISDMKMDTAGREFINRIVTELPSKLPVV